MSPKGSHETHGGQIYGHRIYEVNGKLRANGATIALVEARSAVLLFN